MNGSTRFDPSISQAYVSSQQNAKCRFLLALRPSTLAPTGSLPLQKDGFELLDDEGGTGEAACPAAWTVTDEREVFVLNYFFNFHLNEWWIRSLVGHRHRQD